jgi:hypothetical protein
MAYCAHCHKEISPKASTCPHCGEPKPVRFEPPGKFDTIQIILFGVGFVAGLVLGAIHGFSVGGIGGAILFGFIGMVLGTLLGVFAPYLAIIAAGITILWLLWDVGR